MAHIGNKFSALNNFANSRRASAAEPLLVVHVVRHPCKGVPSLLTEWREGGRALPFCVSFFFLVSNSSVRSRARDHFCPVLFCWIQRGWFVPGVDGSVWGLLLTASESAIWNRTW
jgi:hypothetical protein